MARRFAVAVALAAVVAGAYACKRVNGAYCDDAHPCPLGSTCDLMARECGPPSVGGGGGGGGGGGVAGGGGGGGGTGNCGPCSGTTPLCAGTVCIACTATSDGDAACAMLSSTTPRCAPDGSCVGCLVAGDCPSTLPFCDQTTHQCRGCVSDLECPSYVCELTPGMPHLCVDPGKVEYVDGNAATNGNGLSFSSPRQKIQDAINHATGSDKRPYVRIAAGTYNENVGNTTNGVSIYLVGADGVVIAPTNGDALGAGSGATLTVRNLIASAASGNGANCQNAAFNAYRTQFIKNPQNGVYALNCQLLVDASWVDSNTGSGIYIGGGNFTVVNSIITRNNNSGGFYQLAGGASATTQIFVNNTVADNTASGSSAGVTCASSTALVVRNSILFDNKGSAGSAIAESNCMTQFCASDDPTSGPTSTVDLTSGKTPGFTNTMPISPASYHLAAGSACIDRGSTVYATDHDYDFEPRPDPKSMKPDIGADEVQ